VVALLLLAGAAAGAVALRRRAAAGPAPDTTLDVLESITIGPAQSLRLVAVGDEVLLLSVGADGARMLRHWPRATFDRRAVSLHDALALDAADHAAPDAAPPEGIPSQPGPEATPFQPVTEAPAPTARLEAPSVPPRGVLFPPPALPAQFLAEPVADAPHEASFASVLRQFQTEDA
jgi:flagellar biogenesis protein FliO